MKLKSKKEKSEYSFAEDIFFARPIEREYNSSVQMGDFIFDLDKKNKIVGFEILNASKVFNVKKLYLYNMKKIKIEIVISKDTIKMQASISTIFRNAEKTGTLNIERIRPDYISESRMDLTASA